ncbi:ATP-dependent RNA helicase dbp7 [Agyrium rufum]|nr:ATP-dependent RNA helicase dbp7 [Agyrium rufum]
MAEDGLLVNFDIGDTTLQSKPTFRGGRWKDRLVAKKKAIRSQRRPDVSVHTAVIAAPLQGDATQGAVRDEPDEISNERPTKRPRTSNSTQVHSGREGGAKGPREVVSSLFSYNPSSTLPASKQAKDEAPAVPSNAPLLDGLDTFTSLGLSTPLATHLLTKMNLKAPTAIQKSALPELLKGDSDAFVQAETGSGKTLAYLLPIVQRLMALTPDTNGETEKNQIHRDSGLFAIILAPTRELCKQIYSVLESLLRCAHWIVSGSVIGGEKKKSEKARLRKGVNILVATPGRLADHLNNTEVLDTKNVRWLVLDEGDRLMELGFEEEIRGIVDRLEARNRPSKLENLPKQRITILCSATMKMNVQKLGEISLKDATHIKAEPSTGDAKGWTDDTAFSAPMQLQQSYMIVPPKQRLAALVAYLNSMLSKRPALSKAIVFFSCADTVDFHFELLSRKPPKTESDDQKADDEKSLTATPSPPKETSHPSLATVSPAPLLTTAQCPEVVVHKLHGSLPQPVRTATLNAFHKAQVPSILLCTDVASRGLDLPNIDLVIEYDPPFSSDDHVHRIGRSARAGKDGRATIFLMPGPEEGYVEVLRRTAGERVVAGHDATSILRKGFSPKTGVISKDSNAGWQDRATEFQLDIERWVLASPKNAESARKAYISHVRAYATHVAQERKWFDVKSLHLGHLAKAFGLRERPGHFGRVGTTGSERSKRRPGVSGKENATIEQGSGDRSARKSRRRGDDDDDGVNNAGPDIGEGRRKMRMAMRAQQGAANEFNIG